MNAVEIEEAISALATQPFDKDTFAYDFLESFGNKPTTLTRLKSRDSNKSDLPNGVLQVNNIHIIACDKGKVPDTITALHKSPQTKKHKAKFILATDGETLQAVNTKTHEPITCTFTDFPNHFGFFLPLAGITTIQEIQNNPLDIKATGSLNKLYIELINKNPDWARPERRPDMNRFMARLIFCFFAEDTDIFKRNETDKPEKLFTETVGNLSDANGANTHAIIKQIFDAMNVKKRNQTIPRWANKFPYVNGGLFIGDMAVPIFNQIARSYLLNVGRLDWKKINPDIFGSMIQAIADDAERGALGMHYTSVPNILKVLNPLFLDNLRGALERAHKDASKLKALRGRIARIRVFDPACGSGNFLVIAYKEMRAIEAEINSRLGEPTRETDIPLRNFRGIELEYFAAEVARLALIIANYQCDTLYCEVQSIIKGFLPLDSENWITQGNALRMDWFTICPQTDKSVKFKSNNLLDDVSGKTQIDFKNKGGETYICGNPPYKGSNEKDEKKKKERKADLKSVFARYTNKWASLDYVACWFMKAAEYNRMTDAKAAFVATNSICQGQQVPILWRAIFEETTQKITFAYTSFKWRNLASYNAGVAVVIVGIGNHAEKQKRLFSIDTNGESRERQADNINAYLLPSDNRIVDQFPKPIFALPEMNYGNKPVDGGNLLMTQSELNHMGLSPDQQKKFIRKTYGADEFIKGKIRYCLWIEDADLAEAMTIEPFRQRIEKVRQIRLANKDNSVRKMAERSHQMREMNIGKTHTIVVPRVSSETRDYLPVGLLPKDSVVPDAAFALYDPPLWNLAILSSRLHLVWITTICGKLETRLRYSNQLGWNTFPIPEQPLTPMQKTDLTRCAENILLAREAHFPATIADLYKVKNGQSKMPDDLATAHRQNDEVLERIYKGRVFKNDTERLETLFEMYTKMTGGKPLDKG